ncbi:MAG: hypothetical protein KBS83_02490, partial [Lachnospiraceae bacterium]|nr:hypothetical protein [Candidatus Equihabitans merdae]
LFSGIYLLLVFALLSAILPWEAIPCFAGFLIIGYAFGIGLEAAAIAALVVIMLVVLFLRFAPKSGPVLLLMPITMFFGVTQVVPVCAGLKHRLSSVFAVGSSVVVYYLIVALNVLRDNGPGEGDMLSNLEQLTNGVFGKPEMVMNLVVLCAVFIITYAVRNLAVAGSYPVSVGVGSLAYPVLMLIASALTGVKVPVGLILISTIVSIIVSTIFVFFIYDVDYKAAKYLQFEDDDYFYYVKALPKNVVVLSENPEEEDPEEGDLE